MDKDKNYFQEISEFLKSKDGVMYFRTGGSTAKPKRVKKFVQNVIAESNDLFDELKLPKNLVFISTTTPEHLFGFTFHYVLPILHQYKFKQERINYPEELTVKNALLITTPSFLSAMQKYNIQPEVNPQVIICGGAKLENNVFEYARSISERVIEIYGSTETGVIAYRENEHDDLKLMRGVKIIETNEEYTKISTDYSSQKFETINDRIAQNGNNICFLERTGRVLKVLEKRIDANYYESKINQTKFITESFCFEFNGKLAIFAALNVEGKDFLIKHGKQKLISKIKHSLDLEIMPQKWNFSDEIPRTEKGKINRELIKEIFELQLSYPLILSRKLESQNAQFELSFLRHSDFFKGHFDGYPILAGVVQLFYANFFARMAFGEDLHCGQIRKIKFANIIHPDEKINLVLEKNKTGINWKYVQGEKTFSSGILPCQNIL